MHLVKSIYKYYLLGSFNTSVQEWLCKIISHLLFSLTRNGKLTTLGKKETRPVAIWTLNNGICSTLCVLREKKAALFRRIKIVSPILRFWLGACLEHFRFHTRDTHHTFCLAFWSTVLNESSYSKEKVLPCF